MKSQFAKANAALRPVKGHESGNSPEVSHRQSGTGSFWASRDAGAAERTSRVQRRLEPLFAGNRLRSTTSASTTNRTLVFLHIPKTAGTTLNRIIEWQYSPAAIFTIDPHRFRATAARFETFSEERRRGYQVVRGHLLYGIHEHLPQQATYLTMLRDPVSRLLSSYHFILRRPLHPLHAKLKRERLGVEELIRLTPHRQNLQCRAIAGISDAGTCDSSTLETAKQNLERSFSVVGLSERFEDSLLLMMAEFGWRVSFYINGKVAKARPKPDQGLSEFIREHNQFDVELYDFGKQLFERALGTKREKIEQLRPTLNSRAPINRLHETLYSTAGAARFLTSKFMSAL